MKSNLRNAKHYCEEAMALLDAEIEKLNQGLETDGNIYQLNGCKNQVEEMLNQIKSEKLPAKPSRISGMGHMIADAWPAQSKLGDALMKAEQYYRAIENT